MASPLNALTPFSVRKYGSSYTQQETTIDHLPPEVIAECFRHALPSRSKGDRGTCRATSYIHGVLAAVCKRWYTISCTTPSLWTVVPVMVPKGRNPRPMAYALQLWLARSGALPLEVIIDVPVSEGKYWRTYQYDIEEIMTLINKESHRVVVLRAAGVHSWLTFLDFERPGAQGLCRLEIVRPEPNFSGTEVDEYDVSPDERLDPLVEGNRRIRIGPLAKPATVVLQTWAVPQLGIGTDKLTHLTVAHFRITDVLDVLDSAPRLVFCSLSNCISPGPIRPLLNRTTTPKTHARLKELIICSPHLGASELVLKSLWLPSLESFQIVERIRMEFLHQFLAFVRRGGAPPPLSVLHFDGVTIQTRGVEGVIAEIVQCIGETLTDFAFRLSRHCASVDVMRSHELVDAIFGTGVDLPLLRSVTLYGLAYRWSYTLLYLVQALSRVSALPRMPPKIKLYFVSNSSGTVTVDSVLALSCFNQSDIYPVLRQLWNTGAYDELPAISSTEILDMLELIHCHSLSIAVCIDSHSSCVGTDVDIFPELMIRLLVMCNT